MGKMKQIWWTLPATCLVLAVSASNAQEQIWTKAMTDASHAASSNQQAQAVQYYEKALAEAQKFGAKDPRLDKTLIAFEQLYESQKNWPKAEAICRQVLSVREKSMGPEHLGFAQSLNNL